MFVFFRIFFSQIFSHSQILAAGGSVEIEIGNNAPVYE